MNFSKARELFRDVVDLNNYVPLQSSEKTKLDLIRAIKQKEKMVFLMSEAGSGKSMMLNLIYEEYNEKYKMFFFSNPFMEIDVILRILKELRRDEHYTFLLDEAQLLSEEVFENLRIYADSGNITLIFATHETDLKKLLIKKHFRTRINYILTIPKPTEEEIEDFIKTKLIRNDLGDISSMIRRKNYKLIYKYTKGSLRAVNQLMFKLFDILDFFYNKNPNKINTSKLQNKFIEMAHMDIGELHA